MQSVTSSKKAQAVLPNTDDTRLIYANNISYLVVMLRLASRRRSIGDCAQQRLGRARVTSLVDVQER